MKSTAQVYAASAAPATGTDFLKSQTRIVAAVAAREAIKEARRAEARKPMTQPVLNDGEALLAALFPQDGSK